MSGEQDPRELAAAYALGALEPAEARAFEAFLATSPETQREVAELREVGALLALNASTASPAAGSDLKARVLARATRHKVVPLPVRRPWGLWIALAASLVTVVGLGMTQSELRQKLMERTAEAAALRDSLVAREEHLALREAELNAILDPNVQLTRMGTPGTPQPVIQLFWNRKTNRMIAHAFQLRPAAAHRAYQLWFIPRHGAPIPSVTFNSEPSGHALVQQIEVPSSVVLAAAAITDEPEGGSSAPTTPVLLVGTLSSN